MLSFNGLKLLQGFSRSFIKILYFYLMVKLITMKIPKDNKNTKKILEQLKKDSFLQEIARGKILGDGCINKQYWKLKFLSKY